MRCKRLALRLVGVNLIGFVPVRPYHPLRCAGDRGAGGHWADRLPAQREIVMVGRVARAGGAALAVLAMAAGGVVAGGGGAGAFSVDPGSTAGAPVCKPFTDEDELPQALCDDLRFEAYAPVGDFDVWLSGRERVYSGENHAVRAGFRARDRKSVV